MSGVNSPTQAPEMVISLQEVLSISRSLVRLSSRVKEAAIELLGCQFDLLWMEQETKWERNSVEIAFEVCGLFLAALDGPGCHVSRTRLYSWVMADACIHTPLISTKRDMSPEYHVYVAEILFFDFISTKIPIVVQADYDPFPTPYPFLRCHGPQSV